MESRVQSTSATPNAHGFLFIQEKHIPSLNLTVQEFQHEVTGAQHIHMRADSEENVFLVALRTVPEDSSGVAHILEHTALCGSEKYPVRDPFFMMTRRSLNTFMNAFTSSDWTAYPFSSLNKKDFNNLLDVYLDAVFFSRLDPLDFAQEGHRLEFQEEGNTESPLVFKGVVFNEMKGAMSAITSQLWHTLTKYLFPTSTYHYNSGGEPEDIPNLTYEQLMAFYRTHYHPSNAIFMTYGDITAETHQEKFAQQVLHKFTALDQTIEVTNEKRYFAPIRVQESYANNDDNLERKTHVVVAWLLGESANLDDSLRAQLLASVLLDNSASPLMLALESTDLGTAPSPLCGLDDSQKELSFICGLAGTETADANDVETLIRQTLEQVAHEGVAQSDLESALHQLELNQREVGGDSYPYGLQLILKALTSANHRGDPAALLDMESALNSLREDIKKPNFIQDLAKSLLLENPHRVRLTLSPDSQISERQNASERAKLDAIKAQLSTDEKTKIVQLAADLKARQDSIDDPGALPKVTLRDVPEKERSVDPEVSHLNSVKVSSYKAGTNGLVYQQSLFDLPAFSESELENLSLYSTCVTELGAGDASYLDMQKRQSAVSGGVSAYSSVRGEADDANSCKGYFVYSGKALRRNHGELSALMNETISGARFDEHSRIREIISQIRVNMEQSVTGNGHILAMNAASAGISASARLSHRFSGLDAIKRIKTLDADISKDDACTELASNIANIHKKIVSQASQLLVIGESDVFSVSPPDYKTLCTANNSQTHFDQRSFKAQQIHQAWLCNSQVNFCAKAFPTVAMAHEDAAPLVILGNFLRNGYLHKTIREQGGAYGGGASQDNNGACFRFYSYRDPRIAETLSDFDQSIDWLKNQNHAPEKLEEAILGAIGSIDRSESPAGQAKRCFHSDLHGRNIGLRQIFRHRILNTTLEDLIRVAETYLQTDKASTAIITGKHGEQTVSDMGLTIIEL